MLSIAESQIQASIREVEVAGVHYRIRAISSTDILQVGGGFLLALHAQSAVSTAVAGESSLTPEAERARRFDALRRDPGLLVSGHKFQEAVVCASVFEASLDGEAWQPHRFVLDPRQEHGPSGRAHVSVLRTHVSVLAKAVMALTNGEGHGGEGQASFPAGSPRGPEGAARADRESVRH